MGKKKLSTCLKSQHFGRGSLLHLLILLQVSPCRFAPSHRFLSLVSDQQVLVSPLASIQDMFRLSTVPSPTTHLTLVELSDLSSFKLKTNATNAFSFSRVLQYPYKATTLDYSTREDRLPPLPDWFPKEQQEAIRIKQMHNLA